MWTEAVSMGNQPMGARGEGWGGVWKARPKRGRVPTPGHQRHALGVQKPDFSTGEKEHRIAGPSVAEVQFLHHPSCVLGARGGVS